MKKYDLIIIGGGPAGITAGIYAARQRVKVLLITKNFGGQIAKKAIAIENWPGNKKITGKELTKKFKEHLESQEIEIKKGIVRKVKKEDESFLVLTEEKGKFKAKAVIVATGADPRPLEVPGEKKFIGKGVSYCVTCDGPVFKDETVVVVGGGNAGFEAAIFMTNYAKKIYILEYAPEVKADKVLQKRAKKTGKIKVITNVALEKIQGDDFVNSIIYQERKSKKKKTLKAAGVFVEIGNQPATSFVKGLVNFNKRDEIKVEFETYQAKTPGLYAVGDVNVGSYKQIVTACGEGAKAALSAYQYIRSRSDLDFAS